MLKFSLPTAAFWRKIKKEQIKQEAGTLEEQIHPVNPLLRNRLYPTYQLHATMGNKKTAPQDGLRLAALTVMEWLRQRLQNEVPAELDQPGPEHFRDIDDTCLKSLHMSSGYVLDIVSLPSQGLWTLQIMEPDLGYYPGNPEKPRPAVPGRVIETNIGFHIVGAALECGFQIIVSDPAVAADEAEVYRPAVIRWLMNHPDFGLRQVAPLSFSPEQITTVEQIKNLLDMRRETISHLPAVAFTYARQRPEATESPLLELPVGKLPPAFPLSPQNQELPQITGLTPPGKELPIEDEPVKKLSKPQPAVPVRRETKPVLPYDVEAFAAETATFARTFVLTDELLPRFNALAGTALQPGDIVLLEPARFGGEETIFPYRPSKSRQEEAFQRLREIVLHYPRGKEMGFGAVTFLSSARQELMESARNALEQNESASQQFEVDFQAMEEHWKAVLAEKERECHTLREQLARARKYQTRLEREKEELRLAQEAALKDLKAQFHSGRELTDYLRRKLDQPKEHTQIAAWVKEHFSERLVLHARAAALLEDKSAQTVDVGLICDALDFLATDYWEHRYLRISDHQMKTRCSNKYGRPFEIKPTGDTTIHFTPGQYKIKYFVNERTKKTMESPLDYHLRVGSDPENLLRIYFLHDDERQLIVVGSLPKHLRAVTIK